MEIRGLTEEQIRQAVERATKKYNGNLELKELSVPVPLEVPEERSYSYTRPEGYVVYTIGESGMTPYSYTRHETKEIAEREADAARVLATRGYHGHNEDNPAFYVLVRFEKEEEVTNHYTVDHTYEYRVGKPLNKRGDAYSRVRLGVKTARRPGSRVSQIRYSYFGPLPEKRKRIASACWHAHRDFMYEVFAINPDARIKSALATYNGLSGFEREFPGTYYSQGMAGPCPIEDIGSACNCDEGDCPEYAVEMLTEEQYDFRLPLWNDSDMKTPKREKAVINSKEKV